jgi:hypothetical protein
MLLAVTGGQLAFTIALASFAYTPLPHKPLPLWFCALVITAIIVQLATAALIVKAIMPHKSLHTVGKIVSKKTKYTPTSNPSWLLSSFNHVSEKERVDFEQIMYTITLEEMFEDLTTNYYNLCHIITSRYTDLRKATLMEMIGFIVLLAEAITAIIIK